MPDPIASATELTVRYGPHTVLDRATIAIDEGERIGLVGRNGSRQIDLPAHRRG